MHMATFSSTGSADHCPAFWHCPVLAAGVQKPPSAATWLHSVWVCVSLRRTCLRLTAQLFGSTVPFNSTVDGRRHSL